MAYRRTTRAGRGSPSSKNATLHQLLGIAISGLCAPLRIVLVIEREFLPTSFFVVLWAVSPLLMRWMGAPGRSRCPQRKGSTPRRRSFCAARPARPGAVLRRPGRTRIRRNWLPPDNSQLALRVGVAERTSPTNVGLWPRPRWRHGISATLRPDEFCLRCSRTIETLARMERYEGHLLNWYDTPHVSNR